MDGERGGRGRGRGLAASLVFLFYQQEFPGDEASEDSASVLLRCAFCLDYLTIAHVFFSLSFSFSLAEAKWGIC